MNTNKLKDLMLGKSVLDETSCIAKIFNDVYEYIADKALDYPQPLEQWIKGMGIDKRHRHAREAIQHGCDTVYHSWFSNENDETEQAVCNMEFFAEGDGYVIEKEGGY
jgi:hypothetical protein